MKGVSFNSVFDIKAQWNMARKKNRMIRYSIIVVLILIIGVFVFTSPIFNIKNIKIVGNNYYNDQRIIEIIGIKVNDNWFKKVSKGTKLSIKNVLLYLII